MTYLAPRQGQFAMVLLLSFCLQVGVFVTSSYRTLKTQETNLSETLITAISEEISTPLLVGDRVSLSVIANRYHNDPFVGYVGIYDRDGELVLPVGRDDAQEGKQAAVTANGQVLGEVVIKPTPISRASIVSEHWVFLLTMLGGHGILWLLYGHIARPTQQLYDDIRRRTRQQLLAAGVVGDASHQTNTKKAEPSPLTHYFNQLGGNNATTPPSNDDKDTPTPASGALVVQLAYKDKDGLLSALADAHAQRYFALCDELLQKTLKQLLLTPSLSGVTQDTQVSFSASGTFVSLVKKDAVVDDAKLVLASAMFAKLMVLVGETVYQKHRELKYFALPIKAVVCEPQSQTHARQLLEHRRDECLVMLPKAKATHLTQSLNITPLEDPKSVYERQSYVLGELSSTLAGQLTRLRGQILTEK